MGLGSSIDTASMSDSVTFLVAVANSYAAENTMHMFEANTYDNAPKEMLICGTSAIICKKAITENNSPDGTGTVGTHTLNDV